MRRDPLTGKMVPVRAKLDLVSPKPLPQEVAKGETARVADALADIRQEWVSIGPSKRAGITGDKLMRKYRKLSMEFWHLTGRMPPPIYADL